MKFCFFKPKPHINHVIDQDTEKLAQLYIKWPFLLLENWGFFYLCEICVLAPLFHNVQFERVCIYTVYFNLLHACVTAY